MPRRKPKRITKEVSPVNATLANAESIEPGEIQAQPRRLQQQLLDDETQALQVQKRIKLDDCHKCILLGVSDESKAYRLYDPVTKKITISRDDKLVVSVYVDDLLFTGDDDTICAQLKSSMQNEFEMTDMGRMKFFLGVEVQQSNNGIHICQKKYAKEVLERFNMWNCNSVRNPIVPGTILSKEGGRAADATHFKQLAGCLMYLTVTRPDLMFAVCLIARFMADPKEEHMAIAKRILRKSTSGYVFLINGAAICWSSRKQAIVTLSSTEAEYVAATSSACHSVWLKGISQEKL